MHNFLLADDHSIVRSGIKALILENFQVGFLHEAATGNEVVLLTKQNNYGLIILDVSMPDTDFFSLVSWLNSTAPETKLLIFTAQSERLYGVRCMRSGASGFLNKASSDQQIIHALHLVLNNRKFISPELAELIIASSTEQKITNPFESLSSREMEITMLLHKGKSLPEICQILNIQYSTGNTYKRRIFEKLNVVSLMSLERLLQMHGIDD